MGGKNKSNLLCIAILCGTIPSRFRYVKNRKKKKLYTGIYRFFFIIKFVLLQHSVLQRDNFSSFKVI
jgi:hypothetical protein